MKLAEIREDEILETVWLHDLTPEEIMTIELLSDADKPLLYDDFVYNKYLEKSKSLKEAKALFRGGQKAFVVHGGHRSKVRIRRRAGTLSAKQKSALRRARRKANTGAAKIKRARSMRVRRRLGLRSVKGGRLGGRRISNR